MFSLLNGGAKPMAVVTTEHGAASSVQGPRVIPSLHRIALVDCSKQIGAISGSCCWPTVKL